MGRVGGRANIFRSEPMNNLMQIINSDHNQVFTLDIKLPSGNRLIGTIGPMIGDVLQSNLAFETNPATEDDIAQCRLAMDAMMGKLSEGAGK